VALKSFMVPLQEAAEEKEILSGSGKAEFSPVVEDLRRQSPSRNDETNSRIEMAFC
jgi:hypothetical protein